MHSAQFLEKFSLLRNFNFLILDFMQVFILHTAYSLD